MGIYCSECGKKINENNNFCGKCGAKLISINSDSSKIKKKYKSITCPSCSSTDISKQVIDHEEKLNTSSGGCLGTICACILLFLIFNIVGVIIFIVLDIIANIASSFKNDKRIRETIGICNDCGHSWTISQKEEEIN